MDDILHSFSTSVSLAKQLVEHADKTNDTELKLIVSDLTFELNQVQKQVSELIEENAQLKLTQSGGTNDELRPVIYGAYFRRLKLAGATVGQIRNAVAQEFGLDHSQIAYLDGEVVDDVCEMTEDNQMLEFLPGCLG